MFLANLSFAQTLSVTATLSPATCSGTLVSFDLEYIPTASVATTFDFNSGDLPVGWNSSPYIVGTPCDLESTPPASYQDGSNYFWATVYNDGNATANNNANPKVRYVETNSLNVLNGGTINFLIRYGADDPFLGSGFVGGQPLNNCEDPDEPREQVYLQYSIDNGATWNITPPGNNYNLPPFLNGVTWTTGAVVTDTWDTTGGYAKPWYRWYPNNIEIPNAAKSTNTKFRWYQPSSSNYYYDNWGLDDVTVNRFPAASSSWTIDFGDGEIRQIGKETEFDWQGFGGSGTGILNINGVEFSTGNVINPGIARQVLTDLINASTDIRINGKVSASTGLGGKMTVTGLNSEAFTYSAEALGFGDFVIITEQNPLSSTLSLTYLYLPSNQDYSQTLSLTTILSDGDTVSISPTIFVPASDTTPPIATAPVSVTADTDPGDCFATITDIGSPTFSDNCLIGNITNNKPLNNQYPKGVTSITWYITDHVSNVTTVTQTIIVIDNEFPNLTIPADVNSSNCSLALLAANTADNCGPAPTITKSIPDGYVFSSGQTAVIWQAEDSSSNITSKTQLVTITDITPPTATVTPITLETDAGECYKSVDRNILLQYAADPTDNCQSSINITDNIPAQLNVGVHSVTYIFSDDTGNQTTLVQSVTIVDLSAPAITPPADINSDSCVIVLGDPTINDNCTYTISNNAPPTFPAGNTIVTWTVSDSSGNISTATQNVFFNDNTDPTILIDSNPIVGVDPGLCTASAVDLGTEITNDDCSVASVTNNAPDTFQIGVTTVTWTVEDSSGNIAIATQTVTVVDDEKPVARGRDIVIELNRNGTATVTKDQINNGSSDNCLLESFGISKSYTNDLQNPNNPTNPPPVNILPPIDNTNTFTKKNSNTFLKSGILTFSCNDVGVKQVTLLATDSSGNTDEVIVNVTILASSLCSTSTTSTPTTDPDSDGDGFLDSVDAFPNDPLEWIDTDGDNIGNNSDNDDDGDGFSDDIEIINNSDPLDDNSIPIDIDGDGLINPEDLDDDGDGFSDIIEDLVGTSPNDNNDFPLDTDNDGIINFYDDDDDNDGQLDEYENICGSDPLNFMFFSMDTDLDGLPDCIDLDDDNDGFSDEEEIFEGTLPKDKKSFPQDYDGDGIAGKRDNCFNVFNPDQLDTDEDTFGDACDNCINVFNPDQRDYDLDLIGNACDDDDDNDGQSDIVEIECNSDPLDENSLSPDYDNDGLPNCIDLDDDNDTQSDIAEINCGSNPLDENSISPDYDNDGILDCNDNDKDNDGIIDLIDLNPFNYDEILISEFISPNGDGINDNWEIIPIERFPNNEVWIYSRAGNLLLNKKQYNNDWNGYYKGNPAPESSYLYMIDLNGDKVIDYKGWFYLTK